ncbi:SDR family NAD(P)-dependent oxidoreductase [Streptomyces sp. NPDC052676]|uniref:SDR family NAD(P)-dependent oxidoreductase n=1 Tax=Streptomyces sp. NPDC052676 TaxID=3154953 RepID=UPI0034485F40
MSATRECRREGSTDRGTVVRSGGFSLVAESHPMRRRLQFMARYSLADKTVLVTGAAGGIGGASARALSARGANLVLVGRNSSSVAALARELGEERALPLAMDVTDPAAMEEAVGGAVDRFGRLDVVFANAGIAPERPATLATMDAEVFERIVEVNVLGVWRTVRASLPQIIANHTRPVDRSAA